MNGGYRQRLGERYDLGPKRDFGLIHRVAVKSMGTTIIAACCLAIKGENLGMAEVDS
jgi:hypothetical protein